MNRFASLRPLAPLEIAIAWGGLLIVGVSAYLSHLRHGGFYLDDWLNGAATLHPSEGNGIRGALAHFADTTLYRPVLVVYVPVTYLVFGMHMTHHLIWALLLAVAVSALLYGVLRSLGVPYLHAWLIAALVFVYPWFDSTRFWATAAQISLSLSFALAGLWIALVGLSRGSRRWHFLAVTLYLLSILTYEVAMPLIAGLGAVYIVKAGWQAAKRRWLIDLGVVAAGGLWVGLNTNRPLSSAGAALEHLGEIVTNGGTVLGRTLLPVGAQRTTLALAVIATSFVIGLVVHFVSRGKPDERPSWRVGAWLALLAGGLVVAALGWTMFIPADPYYTPSFYGMNNRVNGVAGIGLVIAVYASFGLTAAIIDRMSGLRGRLALALPLALALLLGAGYIDRLAAHSAVWRDAYASERAALDRLTSRFPTIPSNTTLFIGETPAYQTLGVPILSTTWDVAGMVRTEYDDGTLNAFPILEGLRPVCWSRGVGMIGSGGPEDTAPYGRAMFVNLPSGRSARPRNQAACLGAIVGYEPGPLLLSVDY